MTFFTKWVRVPNLANRQGSGYDTAESSKGNLRRPSGQASWRSTLDVIATLAMLSVTGVILWNWFRGPTPPPPPPLPTKPISLEGLPLLGAPAAKAAVVIFSDFQCPYCARFVSEIMPALKRSYVDRGLVRVGFRHFPLNLHNRAERAAQSADCAAQQGQFWAMHDALFKNPTRLEEIDFSSDAAAIGLDSDKFESCMRNQSSDRVRRDIEIAKGLGLAGTPSFIVGTLEGGALHATSVLVGTHPFDVFERALGGALDGR